MKRHLILIFFFLLSILSFGQKITIDKILTFKEEKVPIYKPDILSGTQLYLKMSYGSSIILNSSEIKKLKGVNIASIDIVYSNYPDNDTFQNLTRKRIENLIKLNPLIIKDNNIKWKLVRQTSCSDKNSAQKLFHGIVITYRPKQNKELILKEITFLDSLFTIPVIKTPQMLVYNKQYKVKQKNGETKTILGLPDTIYDAGTTFFNTKFVNQDSVVTTVLNRNNWKNMIITADLTGSMSPYTAQLLIWFKLNTTNDKIKQFVFFNDGDMTPDNKKIIGKTGGIYYSSSSDFEDVKKLAFTTMKNGSGGDGPENDIESLIKAIELCPTCNNIILIADNWAPIKDISLLSQIKKPIKIILCGADLCVNTEYLDLARATGGSVHTMENDLTELIKLNEGQKITINEQTYKIENGKFVKISKI